MPTPSLVPSPPSTRGDRGFFHTWAAPDHTPGYPGDWIAQRHWYPRRGAPRQVLASGWGATEKEAREELERAVRRHAEWLARLDRDGRDDRGGWASETDALAAIDAAMRTVEARTAERDEAGETENERDF